MTGQGRFERVDAFFQRARRADGEARERILEEAAREDPELRVEVEALLGEHERGAGRLGTPALGAGFRLWDELGGLPESIGGYRILDRLGSGGMGVVYRVEHQESGVTAALKLVRPGFATPSMLRRFDREALVLRRLDHPGIARILDAGVHEAEGGGLPYIAMELVHGAPLVEHAAAAELGARARLELFASVCDAVQHAHEVGVVHRDLKPANILVQMKGAVAQPKILDFGVARLTDADLRATTLGTAPGQLLGTLEYMSPEQAAGRSGDVDERADVYSLGAMLYELLSRQLPHELEGLGLPEAVAMVCEHDPKPLGVVEPGLRGDLETIAGQALERDPARRYGSAGELAADVRRYLAREAIRARPPSTIHLARKFVDRHRALVTGTAAVLVVAAVVAAFGLRGVLRERDRFRSERDVAEANLFRALVGEAHSMARARESEWWWRAMDNVRRAAALEVSAAEREELRDLAIELHGTRFPCFRLAGDWGQRDSSALVTAFDAPGESAAVGTGDGGIELWSVRDQQPLARVAAHEGEVTGLAFHPREALLASCARDGTVRFWSTPELAARGAIRLNAGPVHDLVLCPSDAQLAAGCEDGRVALLGAWSAEVPPAFLEGHTDAVTALAFALDGRSLASSSPDLTARVWDLASGAVFEVLNVEDPPSALAFAAEGVLVQASPATYGFRRHTLGDASALRRFVRIHDAGVSRLAVRAGRVVTASFDGTVRAWDTNGNALAIAAGGHGRVRGLAVGSEGRWVLAGHEDGAVRLWELAEPSARAFVPTHHVVAFRGERELVNQAQRYSFANGLATAPVPFWPAGITALLERASGDVVFGTMDGELGVISSSGDVTKRWPVPGGAVTCLAEDGERARFASGSNDGRVVVWAGESAVQRYELDAGVGALRRVSWNAEGSALLAAGREGVVVWSPAPDGGAVARAPIGRALAIHAGGRVAVATRRGEVELYDPATWSRERVLAGHDADVVGLTYDARAGVLVSSSTDLTVRVWDTETWALRHSLLADQRAATWFAVDADARRLIGGPESGVSSVWSLDTGHRIGFLHAPVSCGLFPRAGGPALLGSPAGSVSTLDVDELAGRHARTLSGVRDASPDALRIAQLDELVPGGHDSQVWGVATSADDRWVATASHDGTVKVWGEDGGRLRLSWSRRVHAGAAWSAAFDAESRRLATTGDDVVVWDVASGAPLATLPADGSFETGAVFLRDRPWLVTCAQSGVVRAFDLERNERTGELHSFDDQVHQVALDPSGRWLAAACHDGTAALWDLTTFHTLPSAPTRRLTGTGSPIWGVAFRVDGTELATSDEAGAIVLWSLPEWRRTLRLRSDTPTLRSVAFSRDGALLAAGSNHLRAVVWDLEAVERELGALGLGRR